jgi:hypothetical protein
MSAIPEDFIKQTAQLSEDVTRPFPNSSKIYVQGSRPDIRVPMRQIRQADTPASFGAEQNPAITVYDTSGPYSDPDAKIDLLTRSNSMVQDRNSAVNASPTRSWRIYVLNISASHAAHCPAVM